MSTPSPWTEEAVRSALGLPGQGREGLYPSISTDTRKVEAGALFLALEGDRFDGHDFVAEAFARGAAAAVVHRDLPELVREGAQEGDRPLFLVEDTLVALGALARYRRRELGARGSRVVGITGSSGKTTAKELTLGALSARWTVHATPGNLNNRVGVPLTILSAGPDTRILLLEMGTNEPGEIATLTAVAEPETAVITTVGPAHLEKLGSIEGVLEEKVALAAGIPADGWVVVGDEPPFLAEKVRTMRPRVRVAGWGEGADPDLRPGDPTVAPDGCWSFLWNGHRVTLTIPGRQAVTNALLALAVASLHHVAPADAAAGVSSVSPSGMRGERLRMGGLTVLLDCYNANPQSVRAALETLAGSEAPGGRVAVLGSMLELGQGAAEWHRESLAHALTLPLDLVVVVGLFGDAAQALLARALMAGPALLVAGDLEEVGELLGKRLSGGETVLLKGSRGVALERVLPLLDARFGGSSQPARGGE